MTKEGVGRTGDEGGADGGEHGGGRGLDRGLVIFSSLYLYFAYMSTHVDILHPTCPKWGNIITYKIR